jgi:hypothetical protein
VLETSVPATAKYKVPKRDAEYQTKVGSLDLMVWKFADTVKRNWGFLGAESGMQLLLLTFFTFPLSILRKGYCNARISQFQSMSNAGCYIELGHL